jgi:hypothetical protein
MGALSRPAECEPRSGRFGGTLVWGRLSVSGCLLPKNEVIRNCSFLIVTPQNLVDWVKPKMPDSTPQDELFRHRLDNIISLQHPLVRLAEAAEGIDWEGMNSLLGQYYEDAVVG